MKALTFNTNSWHFLLATKVASYRVPSVSKYSDGEFYTYGDSADICTYSRHVMGGLLLLTLAGVAIAGAGFIVSHFLLGIWFSIMLGTWFFSDWAVGAMIVFGIGGFIIGTKVVIDWLYNRRMNSRTKPDGFVKHAYKSWKEKFCVQIEFKDKDE